MRKDIFCLLLLTILFVSCKNEIKKISQNSSDQNLGKGEWLDSSDTLNGISIRNNKIAFFKKMKFSSDQVMDYFIIDSIYIDGQNKKKVGEYLIVTDDSDTLVYKIEKRDKKTILLQDDKKISKIYNYWR